MGFPELTNFAVFEEFSKLLEKKKTKLTEMFELPKKRTKRGFLPLDPNTHL